MSRLFATLMVPVAAVSLDARAQVPADAADEVAAEASAEEPVLEETDGPDSAATDDGAEGGKATPAAPESYTVQSGDTLWNLSQRFLNNPWYWPKIWSYNQDVDNPNWIRPGTVLRFYPGSAPVPLAAEPVPTELAEEELDFEDLGEGGGFEGSIGTQIVDGSDVRRRDFFLPDEAVKEAGRILNSPEEKRWLSPEDRVFINLDKDVEPGTVLQTFRVERDVAHPITGGRVGQIVVVTGEVRVDRSGRDQSFGTIITGWDIIERGDRVGSLPLNLEPTRRVDNTKSVKGYVVESLAMPLSFLGDSYVLVLDKGTADGVSLGNTFTVVRTGDPYTRQYSGMPDEDIGEILVIEANKTSSTGIITSASRVIVPGDRVEMRTR